MPTCSVRSSGSVRAGLFLMSSAVITVTLAGSRRASSGKRVALTTTASSVWAWTGTQNAAASAATRKRFMDDLLGRHPRRRLQVDELQGRSPDSASGEKRGFLHASRPARAFPRSARAPQWLLARLLAYRCGGSTGFDRRMKATPCFPFHPRRESRAADTLQPKAGRL